MLCNAACPIFSSAYLGHLMQTCCSKQPKQLIILIKSKTLVLSREGSLYYSWGLLLKADCIRTGLVQMSSWAMRLQSEVLREARRRV